eukprot:550378-Rhodomonas_salina.1
MAVPKSRYTSISQSPRKKGQDSWNLSTPALSRPERILDVLRFCKVGACLNTLMAYQFSATLRVLLEDNAKRKENHREREICQAGKLENVH